MNIIPPSGRQTQLDASAAAKYGPRDPAAAAERLAALAEIPLLAFTAAGLDLAQRLALAIALPDRAKADAAHVAIAAIHGMSFLLMWNCKHLANSVLMPTIERVCSEQGYAPPRIITPEQLTECT